MAFTHWMLVTAPPTPSCASQKMSPDIARCPRGIESPKAQNHLSRARYRNLHFFTSPFGNYGEGNGTLKKKKKSQAFLLIFPHMVYLQIKTMESAYIVKFLEHGYFSLKNNCQKTI